MGRWVDLSGCVECSCEKLAKCESKTMIRTLDNKTAAAAASVERWMGLLLCTTIQQRRQQRLRLRQHQPRQARRAGWGGRCLLEHATRFWRIDKTSASNRERESERHWENVRLSNERTCQRAYKATYLCMYVYIHMHMYVSLCACEIVAIVSAFTPTTKSPTLRPGMLVVRSLRFLSLSLSVYCMFVRGLQKRQPNKHFSRHLKQLTFQCQVATRTLHTHLHSYTHTSTAQTAWLSIIFHYKTAHCIQYPTYLLTCPSCLVSLHVIPSS